MFKSAESDQGWRQNKIFIILTLLDNTGEGWDDKIVYL